VNKEKTLSITLQTLLELQRMDDELAEKGRRQQEIPQQLLSSDRAFDEASDKLESQKQSLQDAIMKQRALEKELQASTEQLNKKQGRKFEVKSNTEYKALLKEIKFTEQENSKIEDEILLLFDEIDSLGKSVKTQEQLILEKKEEIQREKERLEEEIGILQKDLDTLLQKRDAVCQGLEDDLIRQYEQIRKTRQGQAVVVVRSDVCPGCHLGVPPQTVNEVLQTGEVRNCPHCLRILYCVLPDEEV
jgi:predicted  nucleic acid-binding Zn-ribbon protein